MKQFWSQLPIWGKVIMIVIITFIIYQIYKWIKRKIEASNYNAAVNQSQTALNQLADQGVKPSYGQAQYTSMANALQQAFTGCGAAYSDIVAPTFKQMKNEADIYALIQNYGVRKFDECGWGSFEGDLAAALGYKFSGIRFCSPLDLTCGSLPAINKILKDNGLIFQF